MALPCFPKLPSKRTEFHHRALTASTIRVATLPACQVFDMHRLDVGPHPPPEQRRHEGASGVGKIGGLPLPHAGPILYGVVPPGVLAEGLRQVASLTQLVARCLGVVLPHPVLVCFRECRACGAVRDFGADVVDAVDERDDEEGRIGSPERADELCPACRQKRGEEHKAFPTRPEQTKESSASFPASSRQRRPTLLSFVGSSARKAIEITTSATSRAITNMQQTASAASQDTAVPSRVQKHARAGTERGAASLDVSLTSPERIAQRVERASFACLRENDEAAAAEYALRPPRWREEEGTVERARDGGDGAESANASRDEFRAAEERFAVGMQLLQNDVAALCFRAGADPADLWPAESVLLNLDALRAYCRKEAEGGVHP